MRILAATVVAAALAALGPAAGSSDSRPALRVLDLGPVTVKGVRFDARERVRVTVRHGGEKLVRAVRAGTGGAFRVTFASLAVDRCEGAVTIVARRADGSRATWKLPPLYCPPAL